MADPTTTTVEAFTRPCPRCGVRLPPGRRRQERCADCRDLGYTEERSWARKAVARQAAGVCECGQATWDTCPLCRQVTAYLNQQRLARRRARQAVA